MDTEWTIELRGWLWTFSHGHHPGMCRFATSEADGGHHCPWSSGHVQHVRDVVWNCLGFAELMKLCESLLEVHCLSFVLAGWAAKGANHYSFGLGSTGWGAAEMNFSQLPLVYAPTARPRCLMVLRPSIRCYDHCGRVSWLQFCTTDFVVDRVDLCDEPSLKVGQYYKLKFIVKQ